jgi:hypothetical protein
MLGDFGRHAPRGGTLEYVPGTHLWPLTRLPEASMAKTITRPDMRSAAEAAGVAAPAPFFIADAVFSLDFWPMRVSGNDDVESGHAWIELKLVQIVQYKERPST